MNTKYQIERMIARRRAASALRRLECRNDQYRDFNDAIARKHASDRWLRASTPRIQP